MIALNYTTLRGKMKDCFDQITDNQETMIITRKKGNIIMMPQESYDSLMETLYLLSGDANAEHLRKSIDQYRKGEAKER